MNTNTNRTIRISSVFAVAALLTSLVAANAGGPAHKLPTDFGQPTPSYEIKVVGMPSAGHPLTVQVVNRDTGQLVTNAQVSMQHLVWAGNKSVPQNQLLLVPLESDGRGDYVCMREHLRPGEHVTFRAHVSGDASGTWTTVALNS